MSHCFDGGLSRYADAFGAAKFTHFGDEAILEPDLTAEGTWPQFASAGNRFCVGLGLDPVRERDVTSAIETIEPVSGHPSLLNAR